MPHSRRCPSVPASLELLPPGAVQIGTGDCALRFARDCRECAVAIPSASAPCGALSTETLCQRDENRQRAPIRLRPRSRRRQEAGGAPTWIGEYSANVTGVGGHYRSRVVGAARASRPGCRRARRPETALASIGALNPMAAGPPSERGTLDANARRALERTLIQRAAATELHGAHGLSRAEPDATAVVRASSGWATRRCAGRARRGGDLFDERRRLFGGKVDLDSARRFIGAPIACRARWCGSARRRS